MFVLKTAQIQHFIAADESELVDVISESIRLANGTRVAGYNDKELASMVKIGIARARTYGLTRAEGIAAFVAVMFEIAPRFDEQPEINEVLKDERFSPEVRLSQLFDRVTDEAWIEAQKKYEDSFWFTADQ
jgi:hypothetical protein